MKRQRKRIVSADYNTLEPRQLLATITGGSADDILDLVAIDAQTISYTINGGDAVNLDVTDGLKINLHGGADQVLIDHNISTDISVLNVEEIHLDAGDNNWNVAMVADPVTEGRFVPAGMINGNIRFLGAYRLFGGTGVDVFNIDSKNAHTLKAHGGDGHDLFRFVNAATSPLNLPAATAFGEAGNDRFVYYGSANAQSFGQSGFDILDYRRSNYQVGHGFVVSSGASNQGNERVLASTEFGGFFTADSLRRDSTRFSWIIDGNHTRITELNSGESIELWNFNEFYGSNHGFDRFWVLATAADIEINNADWIQISSNLDASQGNLDPINHHISIVRSFGRSVGHGEQRVFAGDLDGTISPRVIISDMTSDGTYGEFHLGDSIRNLTGGNIYFRNETSLFTTRGQEVPPVNFELEPVDFELVPGLGDFQPEIIVHGSKFGDDVFAFRGSFTPTKVYSHGGDDIFLMGSKPVEPIKASLSSIRSEVSLHAGTGYDRMYANNQRSGAFDIIYELNSTGLSELRPARFILTTPGTTPPVERPDAFAKISFNAALEVARVDGQVARPSEFRVTPSRNTIFSVFGSSESDVSDKLRIEGTVDGRLYKRDNHGSWQLNDGYQPVNFYEIEETPVLTRYRIITGLPIDFDVSGGVNILHKDAIIPVIDGVFATESF